MIRIGVTVLICYVGLIVSSYDSWALEEHSASEILEMIKSNKEVRYQKIKIKGNLNFTQIEPVSISHIKSDLSKELSTELEKRKVKEVRLIKESIQITNSEIEGILSGDKSAPVLFLKNISFNGSIFGNEIDFRDAIFNNETNFREVTFEEVAIFTRSLFGFDETTDFSGETKFCKSASFNLSQFYGQIDFTKSIFEEFVDFSGAAFHKDVYFKNAQFNKMGQLTDFSKANFKQEAHFTGAEFYRIIYLNQVKFETLQISWEQVIKGKPTWWKFWKIPLNSKIKPDDDVDLFRKLEKNFRKLNQLSDANAAYYYVKTLELRKEQNRLKWFVLFLWDLNSGYNINIGRVIIVSSVVILIFWGVYYWGIVSKVEERSNERHILPFSIFRGLEYTQQPQREIGFRPENSLENSSKRKRCWRWALYVSLGTFTNFNFGSKYKTDRKCLKTFVVIERFLGGVQILLFFFPTIAKINPFLHGVIEAIKKIIPT